MNVQTAPPNTSLVSWLADPANHSDQPRHVEVVETHLSWVFLTERYAYKLKKAVDFHFVNFRSPTTRHEACRDEVALNHRLAPSVYMGVESITKTESGEFKWNGDGRAVDWVVKMVRVNKRLRCDEALAGRNIAPEDVMSLVELLARFYRDAPVADVTFRQHFAATNSHVQANREELLATCGPALESTIKSIHADQLLFLQTHRTELLQRFCAGRVVHGHGDLRPEHVYFTNPPVVIDCIEFSKEYRTLDIADELAFFAVECESAGHNTFGKEVMSMCLHDLDDNPSEQLLDFYRSYRACVRAKVAAVRAAQVRGAQAQHEVNRAIHYLHVAQRHRVNSAAPACIIVFGGIGTGKSTLAHRLADELGYELLGTDQVRRDRFGNGNAPDALGRGRYTDAKRLDVYEQLLMRARRLLDEHVPVVIDGSFQMEAAWAGVEALLHAAKVNALTIECTCPSG